MLLADPNPETENVRRYLKHSRAHWSRWGAVPRIFTELETLFPSCTHRSSAPPSPSGLPQLRAATKHRTNPTQRPQVTLRGGLLLLLLSLLLQGNSRFSFPVCRVQSGQVQRTGPHSTFDQRALTRGGSARPRGCIYSATT